MIPSRSSHLSHLLTQKYDDAHAYSSVKSLWKISRFLGRRCMHALASPGFSVPSVLSIVVGGCRSNKGVLGRHIILEIPNQDHSHHTHNTMLFLRAPYGEEKLFALVAPPAGGSWTCYRRMESEEVQLHKTAPAFPQEAQATRHAASESAARKSNDNGVAVAPALGKHHHQHTVPGAQKKKQDAL